MKYEFKTVKNNEGRRIFAAEHSDSGTAYCSIQLEKGSYVPYKRLKQRLNNLTRKGGC